MFKGLTWSGLSKGKKAGIIIGVILVIIAAAYIIAAMYFQTHFTFNSSVNGYDASAKTVTEVRDTLTAAADSYSLTLTDGEENTVTTIEPADIDLTIEFSEEDITKLLDQQNEWAWPASLFQKTAFESDDLVSYDDSKLNDILNNLSIIADTDSITQTTDAGVAYNAESGQYDIIEEVYGNNIDVDQFTSSVNTAVENLEENINVSDYYVQPTVTSDDEALNTTAENLNKVVGVNITITAGSQSFTIPKDTIASWISVDENLDVVYNDDLIASYVSEMASSVNTYGKSHSFKTSYGTTITVSGGNYGWKVDQSAEIEQIKQELAAGEDVSREINYSSTAAASGSADIGSSYVEINLTAQRVFVYVNGSKVVDTPCVTGDVADGNATPTGVYQIAYKKTDAVLKGPTWESPVDYWMPFNGGIGLHDASWRSVFGGTIYKTNGSHGCVNLPTSIAGTVYSNVYAGMPVVVYTLAGTETSTSSDAANAVISKINAIGTVTLDSEAAITAARSAYNALSTAQKAAVTNYSTLTAAEQALANLKGSTVNNTETTVDDGSSNES